MLPSVFPKLCSCNLIFWRLVTYRDNTALFLLFFFFFSFKGKRFLLLFSPLQTWINLVYNKWKKPWGATWRTCPNTVYALERGLVRVQGFLTLHCNRNMWYSSACYLSGHCNKNRIQYCHSTILQLWKFHVVHWSVTNPNPSWLTINQALVSLWLAVVADVTSCKKVRFGFMLKENTKHCFEQFFSDVIYSFILMLSCLEDTIDFST